MHWTWMGTVTMVDSSFGSEQFVVKRTSSAGSSVLKVTVVLDAVIIPSGLALTSGAYPGRPSVVFGVPGVGSRKWSSSLPVPATSDGPYEVFAYIFGRVRLSTIWPEASERMTSSPSEERRKLVCRGSPDSSPLKSREGLGSSPMGA